MPSNEVTTTITAPAPRKLSAATLIDLLAKGDLRHLTDDERVQLYLAVCERHGLDPFTRPFAFISFQNGVVQMYAQKNCTDQLRGKHDIGLEIVSRSWDTEHGVYVVTCRATQKGRADEDDGAVAIPQGGKGESVANAMMKATTKAKRRVTLSISGLGGMLDESELDNVPGARTFDYDAPAPSGTSRNGTQTRREQINNDVPVDRWGDPGLGQTVQQTGTAQTQQGHQQAAGNGGNGGNGNGYNETKVSNWLDGLNGLAGKIAVNDQAAWDKLWKDEKVLAAEQRLTGAMAEKLAAIRNKHRLRVFPMPGDHTQ